MRKRTVKYSAGEIGRVRVVEDFLPAPDTLVEARVLPRVEADAKTKR